MDEVRKTIECSIVPIGFSKPPLDWGTSSRGKLSADEWNVICTVYLPIVLIRIWGYTSGDATARFRSMLHSFLDLVKAVEMANNRQVSDAHAKSYEMHLKRYLSATKVLFPDFSLKPTHHIAMHFGEFMRSMGPSHVYRAQAFERLNYLMQSQNTNQKFGE